MSKLVDIEGVGPANARKLLKAGVRATGSLLKKGATPKGRKEIAATSGINHKTILQWVNHVDLFRIKGVGEEYSDLLEEAGVDTVVELAQRKAENLLAKMVEVNAEKKLVRQLPVLAQVSSWVEQAKKMERVIHY